MTLWYYQGSNRNCMRLKRTELIQRGITRDCKKLHGIKKGCKGFLGNPRDCLFIKEISRLMSCYTGKICYGYDCTECIRMAWD